MSRRVWFTADTHFGHAAIIRACQRPFADVPTMNEALIANWNEVVGEDDTVWHLGDFAYKLGAEPAAAIFSRLRGRKHLIVGNHDDNRTTRLPWKSVSQTKEIVIDGHRIWLSHYAHRTWPAASHGAYHIYGHSHGSLPPLGNSIDAGVDAEDWAYRPVSFRDLTDRIWEWQKASQQPRSVVEVRDLTREEAMLIRNDGKEPDDVS